MIGRRADGYSVFRDSVIGDSERMASALNSALGNWGREADITVEEFDYAPLVAEDLLQKLCRANDTLRALGLERVAIPSELLSLDSSSCR